jgi:hypothetical protein
MMSKFEMALLTVTVVGTLVAWPALQQASFVRPDRRRDRHGMRRSLERTPRRQAVARRRARIARSGIADVGSQAVTASSGCVHGLATPLTRHPRGGRLHFAAISSGMCTDNDHRDTAGGEARGEDNDGSAHHRADSGRTTGRAGR